MRPAPIDALASMKFRAGAPDKLGPFHYAVSHVAASRSWGLWTPEPRCVACAGLYDHGDARMEVWFACLPEASRHMRGILRAAHLTLRPIVQSEGVTIFARVAMGWRPGARMASLFGMELARTEAGDEIWEMRP